MTSAGTSPGATGTSARATSVMSSHTERSATRIEVVPATREEEPILANLLELYAHDFSEFLEIDLREDGRFRYDDLPLYWREPDRRPLLVRVDGKLAGWFW
jgi:hypothetical protein